MSQPLIDGSQIQTGTSAGDIVQLDGSGALPAVDGSNLTNVGGSSPAVGDYNSSGFIVNNSISLTPMISKTFSVTSGDTYLIRSVVKGTQQDAAAGVRIAVKLTTGGSAFSGMQWQMVQYDTIGNDAVEGQQYAAQGNITTANALFSTPAGSAAPFIATGDGHFVASSSTTYTIELQVAQVTAQPFNTTFNYGLLLLHKI